MPALTVRTATAADALAIAALHIDTWRETYRGLVPDHFFGAEARAARERMWTEMLSHDPLPWSVAIAERDGEPVGFAHAGPAIGPDAERGHPPVRELQLNTIYVLAAAHGSGAGQGLLDAVLGESPAQLWVADRNPRAIRFYERNGFRRDGATFIDPRLDGLVELRMVR